MRLLSTIAILVLPLISAAQDGLLKLEDIWGSRQFSAAGLPEISSMKDGLHYSELTRTTQGQSIVKNDYMTGKTVDTLFTTSLLMKDDKPMDIVDYRLSDDESMK